MWMTTTQLDLPRCNQSLQYHYQQHQQHQHHQHNRLMVKTLPKLLAILTMAMAKAKTTPTVTATVMLTTMMMNSSTPARRIPMPVVRSLWRGHPEMRRQN